MLKVCTGAKIWNTLGRHRYPWLSKEVNNIIFQRNRRNINQNTISRNDDKIPLNSVRIKQRVVKIASLNKDSDISLVHNPAEAEVRYRHIETTNIGIPHFSNPKDAPSTILNFDMLKAVIVHFAKSTVKYKF